MQFRQWLALEDGDGGGGGDAGGDMGGGDMGGGTSMGDVGSYPHIWGTYASWPYNSLRPKKKKRKKKKTKKS